MDVVGSMERKNVILKAQNQENQGRPYDRERVGEERPRPLLSETE
jgi:hypothetical protein